MRSKVDLELFQKRKTSCFFNFSMPRSLTQNRLVVLFSTLLGPCLEPYAEKSYVTSRSRSFIQALTCATTNRSWILYASTVMRSAGHPHEQMAPPPRCSMLGSVRIWENSWSRDCSLDMATLSCQAPRETKPWAPTDHPSRPEEKKRDRPAAVVGTA